MKYLPHLVLLALASYIGVATLRGQATVTPPDGALPPTAQTDPDGATPDARTAALGGTPTQDGSAGPNPADAPPQTGPPAGGGDAATDAPPARLLAGPDTPPRVYTHHNDLHRAYPRQLEPMVVLVNNDFNHTSDNPPPSDQEIDAAFQPGTPAHDKVVLALRSNAVIVDDCEWMPPHYWSIDHDALADAIRAKLRIVGHLRRLAPGLKIAIYSTLSDPWLWVGLASHARDGGGWEGHPASVLHERKARWDATWQVCNDQLFPAYDAIMVSTYARVRNADYYPTQPARWWAPQDWLPAHLEKARQSGLPVMAYLWHRFSSESSQPGVPHALPLADLSYLSAIVTVLREQGIQDAALWMDWDERLDEEAVRRIDLILQQFQAP